ncbi:anti-sigma factor [Bosea sp. BK604]|uniref:anti-sigma factor family protein n=1 Tax=Bosea sp. BK604 TaxID=2512180 RepID=UPI001042A09D|nr:anti-sigma factor [Bosea sp. BK604]TCR60567.1 anti-sigma factor RsiW [Bosea sp. BK604]
MSQRPITEDDLHGFIDETLDAGRRREVATYLDGHPDVARRVAGMAEQRDMLRAALAPIAEEPVPAELDIARLIAARRRPARLPRWAAAAAAIVLVALGGLGGWSLRGLSQPSREGLAALTSEAAASWAVYAPDLVRPVEIRADDRTQLSAWVSQRVGRAIAAPDLAASGYRFMGGRIVATAHGPAALFMYDDDRGTRLVMLSRPLANGSGEPMLPGSVDAVSGFGWADNGLGHSVVGQLEAGSLRRIADEMRRQLKAPA